ncbi:MAG: hypothetical protein L0H74_05990, partial [Brachybacterium sp.]|nr:hypothetical protein [Brachybacterium sp.]
PADWAEFVTLALTGAAANVGGIDVALAGRPGSWEADGVRQLLQSTVGQDEAHLWRHRTNPVEITLHIDDILTDLGDESWAEYDAATNDLEARYAAATPEINTAHYAWLYTRDEEGEMVPVDPKAPAWSWDAWRASFRNDSMTDDVERSLRAGDGTPFGAYLPKSPDDAAELDRLEAEEEFRIAPIRALEERLDQQRREELAAYGAALKAHIEATVTEIPDLHVPVLVNVDLKGNDRHGWDGLDLPTTLENSLVQAAVENTPTPSDLPGTPLERAGGMSE